MTSTITISSTTRDARGDAPAHHQRVLVEPAAAARPAGGAAAAAAAARRGDADGALAATAPTARGAVSSPSSKNEMTNRSFCRDFRKGPV